MEQNKKYILTVDQSTSATKAILFNRAGEHVHRTTLPHQQYYPRTGFVEHDPEEIYRNTCQVMQEVLHGAEASEDQVSCLAITNQRETVLIWDRTSGKPVYNAAVWQCQRGVPFCDELRDKGYTEMIQSKTGLIIDPYFSASRLHWIMKHVEGLGEKAQKGQLLTGTMDSWLLWKLTGGKVHATDYSNACRTMLFNIHTLDWDEELIELFGLQRNMFPEVRYSDEVLGHTDPSVIFERPMPIAGILGDSHAALFGQHCFGKGMAKATYGTGSSIMMNIGPEPLQAPEGLVTSIGYGLNGTVYYVYEGNIHCTGDTINWLVHDLQLIQDPAETESLAASVENNNGVYLVPAFVGLGAPYWDNRARACITGMPRNTNKAHIVRAALESMAYQIRDLTSLMEKRGGIPLKELRVDGGPTRNDFLMQFQADILGNILVRTSIEEISALGSAFMAGLATGFWGSLEEIASLRLVDRSFEPDMDQAEVDQLCSGWKTAVRRAQLS